MPRTSLPTAARAAAVVASLTASLVWPALAAGQFVRGDVVIDRAPRPEVLAATVDSLVRAEIDAKRAAGVSVAVLSGSDTLVLRGWGMADLENGVPATPTTVYRIGSITKQFTAALVMQLVDSGRLSLDDDVRRWVPSAPTHGRVVTVRQLLNHTSGIRSYTGIGPRWQSKLRLDMAPDSIVALVATDSLDFEPGAKFRYNNTGYVLLGSLLEKVTGTPYETLLESRLFEPHGLSQTYYCDTRPIIPQRAAGYEATPDGLVNASFLSMTQPFSAGSLCATVVDLVRWQRALAGGRVVSPASYAAMTTPGALADGSPMRYGFGLSTQVIDDQRMILHGGGINGFASIMIRLPVAGLDIVVLTNTASRSADALGKQIARAALGLQLEQAASQ